jgi:hypothetical protein
LSETVDLYHPTHQSLQTVSCVVTAVRLSYLTVSFSKSHVR